MFKTDFGSRLENQSILFNAFVLHRQAYDTINTRRDLSPDQIRQVSDIILDCQEVFADAHTFPDAGEA